MIVGGMFSGKTNELHRQGKRHVLADKKVVFYKPIIDNRYSQNHIVTHDNTRVPAIPVSDPRFMLDVDVDVVLIDEVQFFDDSIIGVIEELLLRGTDVIASGLDMDRYGNPFGVVPYLMAKAENVMKLRAVCSSCGEDAWISYSKFESQEQIVLGAREKYEPLCRSCYHQKTSQKQEYVG